MLCFLNINWAYEYANWVTWGQNVLELSYKFKNYLSWKILFWHGAMRRSALYTYIQIQTSDIRTLLVHCRWYTVYVIQFQIYCSDIYILFITGSLCIIINDFNTMSKLFVYICVFHMNHWLEVRVSRVHVCIKIPQFLFIFIN